MLEVPMKVFRQINVKILRNPFCDTFMYTKNYRNILRITCPNYEQIIGENFK